MVGFRCIERACFSLEQFFDNLDMEWEQIAVCSVYGWLEK
ncbi:hypothetical protein LPU83_2494 [Rhizobium favelukesii]|uniref:Uncharacterized protein n=1 Tax=Rhizobium favelukesii TaxID=348824 RepID=W6RBD3_9HYPH|nr:hypothetical protein LPU83_2494 [Rhizobium favelukesii]